MDLNEYQKRASETAFGPHRQERAVLGLYGELEEYRSFPSISEKGDVLWYCAEVCSSHGLKLGDIEIAQGPLSEVAEARKKFLRGDFGQSKYVQRVSRGIGAILDFVQPLGNAPALNIEKLQGRQKRGTLQGDGEDR